MYFLGFLLINGVIGFRIDKSKLTGKTQLPKETTIVSGLTEFDDQNKDLAIPKDYLDGIIERNDTSTIVYTPNTGYKIADYKRGIADNKREIADNRREISDHKREIAYSRTKQVCCNKDNQFQENVLDDNVTPKSHRSLSLRHKYPLRLENKIFSKSLQGEQKQELSPPEDVTLTVDSARAFDNIPEEKDLLLADTSNLIPSFIINDFIDHGNSVKSRRQITKTKQICCDHSSQLNADAEPEGKRHRSISINHKYSPRFESKIFSRSALESPGAQVFAGVMDPFKDIQFAMSDY